eukprot:m.64578 g.64578  ORF g.64578 m.64578 type:complete len:79 (+) comp8118_c0_seq4:4857-5093(+)
MHVSNMCRTPLLGSQRKTTASFKPEFIFYKRTHNETLRSKTCKPKINAKTNGEGLIDNIAPTSQINCGMGTFARQSTK